jgi:hypothetical protein
MISIYKANSNLEISCTNKTQKIFENNLKVAYIKFTITLYLNDLIIGRWYGCGEVNKKKEYIQLLSSNRAALRSKSNY